MADGSTVWLEFAGKNGHKYRGVGGVLKEKGLLTGAYNGTMSGIRKWFSDNPARFDEDRRSQPVVRVLQRIQAAGCRRLAGRHPDPTSLDGGRPRVHRPRHASLGRHPRTAR